MPNIFLVKKYYFFLVLCFLMDSLECGQRELVRGLLTATFWRLF